MTGHGYSDAVGWAAMRQAAKWGILAAIAVVAVALVAWILWPQPGLPGQTRRAEANGVTVEATLAPGDGLAFTVILDTHTVDLSGYDVVAKSRLETGDGTLRPTGTSQAKDNTGHHVEATLTFAGKRSGPVTLVLEDLGGVPERRLEFHA